MHNDKLPTRLRKAYLEMKRRLSRLKKEKAPSSSQTPGLASDDRTLKRYYSVDKNRYSDALVPKNLRIIKDLSEISSIVPQTAPQDQGNRRSSLSDFLDLYEVDSVHSSDYEPSYGSDTIFSRDGRGLSSEPSNEYPAYPEYFDDTLLPSHDGRTSSDFITTTQSMPTETDELDDLIAAVVNSDADTRENTMSDTMSDAKSDTDTWDGDSSGHFLSPHREQDRESWWSSDDVSSNALYAPRSRTLINH